MIDCAGRLRGAARAVRGAGHSRPAPAASLALAALLAASTALAQPAAQAEPAVAKTAGHAAAAKAAAPVRVPASVTLDYVVNATVSGVRLSTRARLLWQRDAGSYRAAWTVDVPLLGSRTQRSEGAIAPAGLAPARYTESARRERSATFDEASARIHFSTDRPSAVLRPGTQDRLSVSLQLGALLAAAPARYPAGSTITVHTAGVRGAEDWHWRVLPDDTLRLAGRELPAVRLMRQPRKEGDSRIELWLGRTLDYLPVRLRVTESDGDSADQQLSALPAMAQP